MKAEENLEESIVFLGSMSPEEVRIHMEEADIFLFTSDRREGWGAVLNESMGSACAVVADGNIGSVPYLIRDGVNGLIYNSTDVKDLTDKVKYLIKNPPMIQNLGRKAYATMCSTWNGKVAARNLIQLCTALLKGEQTPITSGPCSPAPLIFRTIKGKIKSL
jgi:glycosyltransferase involved in cell wall biosynthesis